MLSWLTWPALHDPEIEEAAAELRADALRLLVAVTTAGYLVWQSLSTLLAPEDKATMTWVVFPYAAAVLGGTYLLQRRCPRRAVTYFLASSVLAVTASIWLLSDPTAILFFPLIALVAVVLAHPLAGLAASAAASVALFSLWQMGPLTFLEVGHLTWVGVGSLIATTAAWVLGRNLVTAVEWSLQSAALAQRNTVAAREHRAQLVQALKQLDAAYYQLQQANAALETAWKAAENAERAKSEFVTNISHELRTPLNLIVGFSELILTAPEAYGVPVPAAYRGDLNAIYRSAQHLLTLTDDVIDLARVGVGRLALLREPADLGQVIKDACDILREYVAANGLWLRIELAPNLPILNIDRLRIRQVLLNLLTNAARFTKTGGITVSASLEGQRVLVQVADTGCGIAPEDVSRVFSEFSHHSGQGPVEEHRTMGGYGLGLSISKRLVELHGGEMGVESVPDVGTTFWFSVPVVAVDGAPSGESWQPLRLSDRVSARERILVLASGDDWLTRFLRSHLRGYQVVAARDLPTASALAAQVRALAILAEIGENGDRRETCQGVPVPIFGLPLPSGKRVATALGATTYLLKPVTRAQLRAAIAGLGRPIRRVLIVDDDLRFVRLLTRILQVPEPNSLYDVAIAHDGRAALDLMAAERPDVVLLDLVMPGLGGREVIAAMRADPRLADVPVIVISAQDQIQEQFSLVGPIVVARPEGFRLEELLGAVEALLGALRPPREYLVRHAAVGLPP
ncbi:MAG: response regulator [Chloroflexi bacterium]|nr:response regulator [Chloroflexota bacterium]